MSDTYTGATERVQQYTEALREDLDTYTGLAIGTGLQTAQELTDRPLFEDYMNPLNVDKAVHAAFSYGLTAATYRLCEAADELAEETRFEPYTKELRDPAYQAAAGFAVVGAFSVLKEFWKDPEPDAFDIAGNYIGYSSYVLKDHHDIDSWTEEGKELGQRIYDSLR